MNAGARGKSDIARRFPTPPIQAKHSTMAWRVVGHILVVVHADVAPSHEDWNALVRVRNANETRLKGQLVVGSPQATIDAKQRVDVQTFMQRTRCKLAVVTDSRLARGAVTAVAWFGVPIRAVAPGHLDEAMDFLELVGVERDGVRQATQELTLDLQRARGLLRSG